MSHPAAGCRPNKLSITAKKPELKNICIQSMYLITLVLYYSAVRKTLMHVSFIMNLKPLEGSFMHV